MGFPLRAVLGFNLFNLYFLRTDNPATVCCYPSCVGSSTALPHYAGAIPVAVAFGLEAEDHVGKMATFIAAMAPAYLATEVLSAEDRLTVQ